MTGEISPDLLRGLTRPRVSRRRALQVGGLSAMGLLLSACSVEGTKSKAAGGSPEDKAAAVKDFWAQQKQTGTLDFENWPLYLDVGEKDTEHPSLDLFTKKTGIKVTYTEGIQQVDSYYGKIQPVLSSGAGIGKDIIVMTNGLYLDRLIESEFVVPLDQTRMTNFSRYSSELVRNPSFDRGNVYTMAWQSGITGIGYDPKKVGRKITSWNDLTDPALEGKIGMFGDNQDLPGCALLALGVAPETSAEADWKAAGAWLTKQRPLVRKYYEQDYIKPLKSGDIWATMAWSGDIFQAKIDRPDLEFVVPDEGAMIWSDNMCIPKYAAHPLDAMVYMDYVYQPEVAATIADYVNYITPVTDAKLVFKREEKDAKTADDKAYYKDLAESPLIFPSAADYSRLHRYRVLTSAELASWNAIFQPVYQS